MSKTLLGNTVSGVKYTGLSTIVTSLLQIVYTGLRQAVIQKRDLSKEDIRVSFTITMTLSIILTIVIWYSAPYWAAFFDPENDSITLIIRVLSISFVVRGVAITANALMIRELMFREDTINSIISYVFGFIVIGISCAALNFGVWSLVYAQLGQLLSSSLISLHYGRHSLKPLFKWKYYPPLFFR